MYSTYIFIEREIIETSLYLRMDERCMVLEFFKMNIFNGCIMRNFLRSELFFDLDIRCDLSSRYNLRQIY